MNLKLDENLPEALVAALNSLGHSVDNVRLEGFAGRNDGHIWQAAQDSSRFLITQDLDFSDIRKFAPGTHCGLMLVRLKAPGRKALAERVTEAFTFQEAESWARCFVLLTDYKLRVRRPVA
jgi:predicted nuclease of predicted toxin-antitoxin system